MKKKKGKKPKSGAPQGLQKPPAAQPGFLQTNALPILLLGLLTILFYQAFLFSDQMLLCQDQITGLDHKVLYKSEISKGRIPLWAPSRLAGMPTTDAMFGDAFHPARMLFALLFPVHRGVGYKIVLHVFLAGLFFFFLMHKGFSVGRWPSFLGATLYMLNTEFISHTYPGHDGKMMVIAMLPLAVWMLERLVNKPTFGRSCLLGLSIGLCLLTSHIQMTYFVLWGLLAYAAFRALLIARDDKDWNRVLKLTGFFFLGVVLGVGLGLVQLLPPYMYVREGLSVRGPHKGMEYATSWSLHPEEAASLIVPEFGNSMGNYWGRNYFKLNSEYAGLLAGLLFVFFLVIYWNAHAVFWLVVAAFSLLYALGAHTPLWKLFYYVAPGVKSFRGPSMMMFWFSFALTFWATRGLGRFLEEAEAWPDDRKARVWKAILISLASVGGCCLVMTVANESLFSTWTSLFYTEITQQKSEVMKNNIPHFVKGLWVFGFLSAGGLLVLGLRMRRRIGKPAFVALLFVIGIIDLWRVNSPYIKTEDPARYMTSDAAIRTLQSRGTNERVFELPGTYNRNFVGIFGLESVEGFHDNELAWYRRFRGEGSRNLTDHLASGGDLSGNPMLNLLNAKTLLYRPGKGKPVQTIENPGAMPRAFLVDQYEVLPESLVVAELKDKGFPYRTTALVESKPADHPMQSDSTSPGTAVYNKKGPDAFSVSVTAERNALLVVSEVYYPGWRVRVNGEPVKIMRAYGTLVAVPVKAGTSHVAFEMSSKYLRIGWYGSLLSGLIMMIAAGMAIAGKRKALSQKRTDP